VIVALWVRWQQSRRAAPAPVREIERQ
jgi:hypothetical protein